MDYCVIIAGGSGQRFWPLSRKSLPKQCIAITSDKPMIQETVERLDKIFKKNIYISTGEHLAQAIKNILSDINFILEPMPKNTAACVGLSAAYLFSKDKDAVMFVETSDHVYNDEESYLNHVKFSLDCAKKSNKIVLLGINPTNPNTGYGYINVGNSVNSKFNLDENIPLHEINEFKEKPTLEIAKDYLQRGNFLWNSGMLASKCSVILEEIKKYLPDLYESLMKIIESNFDKKILYNEFLKLEKVSFDNGILEKSNAVLCVNSKMHWDDVGDLSSFERFLKSDSDGNVCIGNTKQIESNNNIIISDDDSLVSLIGVKDLIVSIKNNVVLVCKKNQNQKVKDMVALLEKDEKLKKFVE